MIHKACMPVYMNSGKIVADGRTGRVDGKIEGSTRGPHGPKKNIVKTNSVGTITIDIFNFSVSCLFNVYFCS